MKRSAIILSLILICLTATAAALAQSYDDKKVVVKRGCEFNIVGTWKAEKADGASPLFYRFTPDAKVTVLSGSGWKSELREIASAAYSIDNPRAPKVVTVKADKEVGGFAKGSTSMEITAYDDTWVSLAKPGSAPTRWVRVDTNRYFMVLAGRSGTFYDDSGPTFPMMIKTGGQQIEIDAVGIYEAGNQPVFGAIPAETYNQFMKEPSKNTDLMLRLEITAAQYERGLKIVKNWVRRARNDEWLYRDMRMNNILLVKQVTESLNECGEKFNLYKLDWSLEDTISTSSPMDAVPLANIPFRYFKELKRRNQSLHVTDERFEGHGHHMPQQAAK